MMTETGQYRQLILFNAGASDVGSYTFTINGQSTSAYLTVRVSGPVDGNWVEWSQWMVPSCPATCGPTASRDVTRSRTCSNPAPSNGGAPCPGQNSLTESQVCGPSSCGTIVFGLRNITIPVGRPVALQVTVTQPGLTGTWQRDGVIITGGTGYDISSPGSTQVLFLTNPQVSDSGRYTFTVRGEVTNAWLTVSDTAVNGNWGEWSQWSGPSCPATCGPTANRDVTRSRTCSNPAPGNGGASCPGQRSETENRQCGPATCDTAVNGNWGEWTQWSGPSCPATCGPTARRDVTRSRTCTNPAPSNGGAPCPGQNSQTETRECGPATCVSDTAVNGNWGEWSPWSGPSCPATCGPTASRNVTRSRTCTNPAPSNGGSTCPGVNSQRQTEQCGSATCVGGGVSDWGNWNDPPCPATCGRAVYHTQKRYRTCNTGNTCTETLEQSQRIICMDSFCPVNGGFTQWSMWTTTRPCSETCGPSLTKTLVRTRTCTNPAPSFGGSACTGDTQQTSVENCNLPVCGAIQSQLQSQSAGPGGSVVFEAVLSQDNAVGYWQRNGITLTNSSKTLIESIGKTQKLTISDVEASDVGNYSFVVNGETTTAALTLRSTVPVDGGFSEWATWTSGQCSVSCGNGLTTDTRNRTCTNPVPQNGGQHCSGPTTDTRTSPCNRTCTVSGGYTQWSGWVGGSCLGPCDQGTQTDTRTRSCTNPRPQNGGLQCAPPSSETRTTSCVMATCAVDGGMTDWAAWVNQSCTETCGKSATRTVDRHRNCSNPEPRYGGRPCTVHPYESKVVNCGLEDCPSTGSSSSFTLERGGLYIGLIAAIIAIGVFLIIIIVACCLWNCRKDRLSKKHGNSQKPTNTRIR
ncbi:A disintegrin and metalloproteinase with thrombospondin motifs adt-1-like isoform X7 [Haliotis rubra]|uniref:A disintegrin and metalloproteinase with thrombospondin motifs adt-1-like isoform X7 n=1 Tax=Haliotis rubra TaxID=36100 RepID=UPI001EE526F6|nr:A disintegrin and metalloproteinase with thrombospondin motifs adt-1-like isoform X7 [Haliotis rubra]